MFEKPDLYNADCMEAMKEFPDKFFDLAIVDPPYGINADTFNNGSGASKDAGKYGTNVRPRGRLNSGGGKLKNCILNKSRFSWDNEIPPKEYFEELKRVSKNQVIWGAITFHYHQHDAYLFGIRSKPGKISARWKLRGQVLTGRRGCLAFQTQEAGKYIRHRNQSNYTTGYLEDARKKVTKYWIHTQEAHQV